MESVEEIYNKYANAVKKIHILYYKRYKFSRRYYARNIYSCN